ncbi:MAG TPA: hypothetical protein VIL92_06060 [Gaiellaceae bacterium]
MLPLLTLDEVRAELAQTQADLDAMGGSGTVVDWARWHELRVIRFVRRGKLVAQIAEMEAAGETEVRL